MSYNVALPAGYSARPTRMSDLSSVTELINTCSIDEIGKAQVDDERIQKEWMTPGFELATDSLVVLTSEQQIVGYVECWDVAEDHTHIFVWGCVHPEHRGKGIGTTVAQWAEERARQAIPLAPKGARVSVNQSALEQNESAQALFADLGYYVRRRFWRMVIEMDEAPPAPDWPEGFTLRTMVPGQDEFMVYEGIDEAFEDHFGHIPISFEKWTHFMMGDPDFDPSLWFLAMDGDTFAGGSLCAPKTTEDPDMGWVNDLAVRRPWRRRGLALALLLHTFGEFYKRGTRKVGLGVDAESLTGATRLYEKAGMHVARCTVSYEKELRPGVELSTQSLEDVVEEAAAD